MKRWIGKVAVVTGASAGIGFAIAEQLAKEGLIVAGFARRENRIQKLSENLKNIKGFIHPVKVDMTKNEEIIYGFEWVMKNMGPVHILINNAGILRKNTLMEGDSKIWKEVFDTNVFGLYVATNEAVKQMKENKIDGHIININSLTGHQVLPIPNINVYPASKFAVTALTEFFRREFLQNNLKIKITSLSPGAVETEILENSGFLDNVSDKKLNIPQLSPKDVANSILYVLSTPSHVQINELIIKPVGESL